MEFSTREDTGFAAEALVVPVAEAEGPTGVAAEVDGQTGGNLADAMARREFRGKKGETLAVTAPGGYAVRRVVFCGVGKVDELTAEGLRKAAGSAARVLVRTKFREAGVAPLTREAPYGPVGPEAGGAAWVEGMTLATYRFFEYKTDAEDREPDRLERVTLLVPAGTDADAVARGAAEAQAVCEGMRLAADLANHPSAVVTPTRLAEEAGRIAAEFGMRLEVLDRDQMRQMGMGGMIGVSQGSEEPPKFIIVEHDPGKRGDAAKPIVLVGKSITFDSGGISIKPAQGMEEMKGDMAGGAAVLGTLLAVARLRLPVRVIGILTAAENMPSGTAQNPGDILRMLSGLTVEVINTDAEGRLVLADGLAYAQRFTPRALVDIATLTGACVVALGHEAIGMMGNDDALKRVFSQVGDETGERVWELPLWEPYFEYIKSDIADIKNTGGRAGGTITAGCFLSKFVGDAPWVHLDIASTAWTDKAGDYLPKGSTGVGVRLMTGFIRRLAGGDA